ncbi:XkdW family protein [uncultured Deinococcus sp.]|uniref:XkdW family protein n=1 Tax=uncultured Deinococcus sp. TaxID=158789 RepID=UPI00258B2B4B|nr:XkdW family protein [uncultured Deinococcus sp.]
MNSTDMALALRHLYPTARMPEDIALADDGTGPQIVGWTLPDPQPTPEELEAALPAAQARAAAQTDLTETQAMLDERYRMFNRATASGNVEDAAEIQGEVAELLAYIQEVRNAAQPA